METAACYFSIEELLKWILNLLYGGIGKQQQRIERARVKTIFRGVPCEGMLYATKLNLTSENVTMRPSFCNWRNYLLKIFFTYRAISFLAHAARAPVRVMCAAHEKKKHIKLSKNNNIKFLRLSFAAGDQYPK